MFRSLLVLVDLAPSSTRVIERATLLTLAKGARLDVYSVIAQDFLGSVASYVSRAVPGDGLLVPPRRERTRPS